jgi:DNA replication protein DnaC
MGIDVKERLRALRLPEVRACYEEMAEYARCEGLSYEGYLAELVELEWDGRRNHRIERFLRASRLPLEKNFESFERKRLPAKVEAQLRMLLEGSFVERAKNVLVFRTPSSGKTHILCALGHELILRGYRVLFRSCDLLVQELLGAKRDLTLFSMLRQFAKYDALIIDDIGYVQQSHKEMEVLFSLSSYRYERKNVMLSSNLPFSQWEKIFNDPMTTAAVIDRLIHHGVILELNVSSYRLKHARKLTKNAVKLDVGGGQGG